MLETYVEVARAAPERVETLGRVMLEWLKGYGVNVQTARFCNHMACQLWYLWIAVQFAEPFQDETERVKVLL
jgi:hypothetical protein